MQSREFGLALPCVASVSVRFQSKEPGARVKDRAKKGRVIQHFFAFVRFFARPKPKISFLGLSLLRNQTETLAKQASWPRPRWRKPPNNGAQTASRTTNWGEGEGGRRSGKLSSSEKGIFFIYVFILLLQLDFCSQQIRSTLFGPG